MTLYTYGTFFDISGKPGDHPSFLETHGNSGTLGTSAYTFKERNNINSLERKNHLTKVWGGMAPVAPWLRHCPVVILDHRTSLHVHSILSSIACRLEYHLFATPPCSVHRPPVCLLLLAKQMLSIDISSVLISRRTDC